MRIAKGAKSVVIVILISALIVTLLIYNRNYKNAMRYNQVLSQLKEVNIGALGWEVLNIGNSRIILNGGSYLLTYKISDKWAKLLSAADLKKIDADHRQGDVYTRFSFDNNSKYAVTINCNTVNPASKNNMYLCNLENGNVMQIGEGQGTEIIEAWSPDSRIFAFTNKGDDCIYIYETDKERKTQISFENELINRMYVFNSGNIVVDSAKPYYIIKSKNGYIKKELKLEGEIIGIIGKSELLIYNSGILSKYNPNTNKKVAIKQIGKDYNYYATYSENILFSNNISFQVYNLSANKMYYYPFAYESQIVSPDGLKLLVYPYEGEKVKIVDNDKNIIELNYSSQAEFETPFFWLDNWNLIKITQKDNSYKYGDFVMLIKEVKTGEEKYIYP